MDNNESVYDNIPSAVGLSKHRLIDDMNTYLNIPVISQSRINQSKRIMENSSKIRAILNDTALFHSR